MDQSVSAQLSDLIESIGERLQLLQGSRAELLNALHDTDRLAEQLRGHLEEAQRLLDGLSE